MTVTVTTDHEANLRTILNWLETYTGVGAGKAVWLNQETPRQAKPYCGILVTNSGLRFGLDHVEQTYDALTGRIQRQTSGPRQLVAQCEVYTDPPAALSDLDAAQRLENALLALDTEEVRDTFRAAKIGVISHGQINRLDEFFNNRWERRAQVDVVFTYSGETFDDGGGDSGDWIETVQIPSEKNGNFDYGLPQGGLGLVWSEQTSNTANVLNAVHGIGDTLRIAAGNDDIIRSTDSGDSWSVNSTYGGFWEAIYCRDNGTCLIAGFPDVGSFIKRSTDSGQNFSDVTQPSPDDFISIVYEASTDAWLVASWNFGVNPYIVRSTNDGVSWASISNTLDNDIYSMATDNNGRIVAIGEAGLNGYSDDGGATWVKNTNISLAGRCVTHDKKTGNYIASGLTGALFVSTDNGINWVEKTNPSSNSGAIISIHASLYGVIIAVGQYKTILRSTDGGETWAVINEEGTVVPILRGVFHGENIWHAVGDGGLVMTAP